jgi:hypothetical protein
MRRFPLLLLAAAVFLAPAAEAQPENGEAAFTLPVLEDQQRWTRASLHVDWILLAALANAKEHGQGAEDFGRSIGRMFATSWGEPGTGTVAQLARGMAANLQMWPGAEVELVQATDEGVTLRVNRPWLAAFGGAGEAYGVTPAEHELVFRTVVGEIASYLGLGFDQRSTDEHMYLVIAASP